MNNFERDLRSGEAVERFLLEHLFPELADEYQRLESLDEQHAEGDVRATVPDVEAGELIIDIKAQTSRANEPQPTFSLEVNHFPGDNLRQGWFHDETKATTHYLFCWIPDASTDDFTSMEQIEQVDCMLIDRRLLREYLTERGYTQEVMASRAAEARDTGESGPIDTEMGDTDCFYYLSPELDEQPFNLVVRYRLLEIMAHDTYTVTADKVTYGPELF